MEKTKVSELSCLKIFRTPRSAIRISDQDIVAEGQGPFGSHLMMREVVIPLAADDPVAAALKDPAIRNRLSNAAHAFLSKRGAALSPIQRSEDCKVVTQEVALRAWQRRDQFDPSRDIVKWLVGFVIHVCQEFVKKRSRDSMEPPGEGPNLESLAIDPSRPLDESIADKLLIGDLLEQLLPADRQVVMLKYGQEMTCAEIGLQIGMNENTVRVRLFRATRKLKHLCGVTGEVQP